MNAANTRVCVIGAGLSGLAVTKELHLAGVDVRCYDMMPVIGGTFASYVWKGGRLTSSTVATWYSDFPVEDRQHFMTWEEFVDYLGAYVDHFDLRAQIELNCKVVSVTETAQGWRVCFRRANHSNGHELHPAVDVVEETFEETFSHLILSTGLHHLPKIPEIAGLDGFAGEVLHSRDYRDAERYRDKRVVVVGAGESSSDIAAQVSAVARTCHVSLRTAPGTLFPKWIQGNTPDIRDDRLTYNLPRRFKSILLRGHRSFYEKQEETPELFGWAAKSNYENQRCPFNSNACKSFGLPEAIVHHGAFERPEIVEVDGSELRFCDGTSAEADVIIFATGFRTAFPILEPGLEARLGCVSGLWKNAVDPEIGAKLMLIGFARPHQINLITTSELQARMAALVISGQRELPSAARMRETIAADRAFMRQHYGDRYERNPALVDQFYFCEGLATFIGCEIPWREVLRRDPKLALKLIYAALSGAHYRLAGPGADWALAARTIEATPIFNNRRDATLRWSVFSLLTAIAWLGGKLNADLRLTSARARDS